MASVLTVLFVYYNIEHAHFVKREANCCKVPLHGVCAFLKTIKGEAGNPRLSMKALSFTHRLATCCLSFTTCPLWFVACCLSLHEGSVLVSKILSFRGKRYVQLSLHFAIDARGDVATDGAAAFHIAVYSHFAAAIAHLDGSIGVKFPGATEDTGYSQ